MLLKGRVMLITNVEKFAGHATTAVAMGQGATVMAHDPNFETASARHKFESEFPGAHALPATDPVAVVEQVLKRHGGRIDALINNDAYPALRAPLTEARMEDYRDALETMAVAPLRLVQLVAPAMRKRKFGRIVFVSSAAPLRGIANYAPYVSARAAANGLVASLAKELGRDGITVNAVGSNYVENPDYFPPALLANKDAMAKMTAQIPLGRLGRPDELGSAVCFLCTEGAGFITGHVLPHAGGWA
jgi:NAD(P)-dependent dehydrogenase (short-subunit alcohol dehydrogenase family)